MTQPDLESLFAPYGRIITSRILCDNITGMYLNFVPLFYCKTGNRQKKSLIYTAKFKKAKNNKKFNFLDFCLVKKTTNLKMFITLITVKRKTVHRTQQIFYYFLISKMENFGLTIGNCVLI